MSDRNRTVGKYRTALSRPSTWLTALLAIVVILGIGAWIGGIAIAVAPGIAAACVVLIVIGAVEHE